MSKKNIKENHVCKDCRGNNYAKYSAVKQTMIAGLEANKSTAEISREAAISLPTFYKYKAMINLETGKNYTVPEEMAHLQKTLRAKGRQPDKEDMQLAKT